MCCRIVHDGVVYKPGDRVPVKSAQKSGAAKWTGFARSETAKATWAHYDVELDIPVEKFAENNRHTGKQTWATVNDLVSTLFPSLSYVIYAIGNRKTGDMKILTREAESQEKAYFGHHRVPVLGWPRF